MTLSTKPEIHANDASHCCHHGRTEPRSRVMCIENFVIHVVFDFQKKTQLGPSSRFETMPVCNTDRQTDGQTDTQRQR